jgi:hypothetical protein
VELTGRRNAPDDNKKQEQRFPNSLFSFTLCKKLTLRHPEAKVFCNYSANSSAITLAPIKGRLCGAKRGGDNNYSPKKGTPD